ncbi:MAG: M50 family metallopeptidase [Clostridia bacterium]|nr:M50 family metallopeptidase [Clostridia bacterium]
MAILYIIYAILLLGVLISVHEFGHFIAARLTGISVKEFSVGFGPKILQWTSKKHETLFSLRPIPMGGYCMFYGDTEDDPRGEKAADPRHYGKFPVWKRMTSVLSGPLMNFALAFIVAVALLAGYGVLGVQPHIEAVEEGMPADLAGLKKGDVFLLIGERALKDSTIQDVSDAIDSAGTTAPIPITVLREDREVSLSVTPILDPAENRYRIGIGISYSDYIPLPPAQVIPAAWRSCVNASGAIVTALGKLVITGEGLNETTGPVGMIQLVAEQTRQGGFEIFLELMVLISINLGVLNLFPIPGLDGSRLVFMAIEAIRGKPVSQRIEAGVHMAGFALLLGLVLFLTFKDIGRIFGIQ